MKLKALITAVLLVATNFAWAQGGLSLDNVEEHMSISNQAANETARPEIVTQGPIDQFGNYTNDRKDYFVDTDKLQQSYNGQS